MVHWGHWVPKGHSARWAQMALKAHLGQRARIVKKEQSGHLVRTELKGHLMQTASAKGFLLELSWSQDVPAAHEALRFGCVAGSERV